MIISNLKKYWYIILFIIIVFLLFFPIQTTYDEPFKIYHSIIDLGFADYGVFSALVVGLLSFTATIYTNDKNLKITKFTILPDEYLTFTVNLDKILKFHDAKRNFKEYDIIETFLQILRLWNKHQKIFKLIYPELYDDLMKFIIGDLHNIIYSKNYEQNAELIIADIKIQIMDEIKNIKNKHQLVDTKFCSDEVKIDDLETTIDIELTEQSLIEYINNIKGKKTKEITLLKFKEFLEFIEIFIERLKNEKENINDFL